MPNLVYFIDFSEANSVVNLALCLMKNPSGFYFSIMKWEMMEHFCTQCIFCVNSIHLKVKNGKT